MEQIWVGMHSIKESLWLLETNAAEEDWDTRYWTWVDREILSEAATIAAEAELHSGAGLAFATDSDRALASQLTVPAIAVEMTVPAAAVEAAPDPDHGLPVDRGPDDAGGAVPAPVLPAIEVASSGSEEEIRMKLDVYADNVTVPENYKQRKEDDAPALEKFSLDEILVPKAKGYVSTKPPEPPAFVSEHVVKKPAKY